MTGQCLGRGTADGQGPSSSAATRGRWRPARRFPRRGARARTPPQPPHGPVTTRPRGRAWPAPQGAAPGSGGSGQAGRAVDRVRCVEQAVENLVGWLGLAGTGQGHGSSARTTGAGSSARRAASAPTASVGAGPAPAPRTRGPPRLRRQGAVRSRRRWPGRPGARAGRRPSADGRHRIAEGRRELGATLDRGPSRPNPDHLRVPVRRGRPAGSAARAIAAPDEHDDPRTDQRGGKPKDEHRGQARGGDYAGGEQQDTGQAYAQLSGHAVHERQHLAAARSGRPCTGHSRPRSRRSVGRPAG